MTATQAMTGQGGWPMTVFMTPDRDPFFVEPITPGDLSSDWCSGWPRRGARTGTTSPARPGRSPWRWPSGPRRPGRSWTWPTGIPGEAEAVLAQSCDQAVATLAESYDAAAGGFGGAPKFPPSMVLEFLLRQAESARQRNGEPGTTASEMVTGTAEGMARGARMAPAGRGIRPVFGGWRLGGAALREDALRQRVAGPGVRAPVAAYRVGAGPPGGPGDLCLDARRARDHRRRPRLGAGRGQRGCRRPLLYVDAWRAGRGARGGGRGVRHGRVRGDRRRDVRAWPFGAAAAHRARRSWPV